MFYSSMICMRISDYQNENSHGAGIKVMIFVTRGRNKNYKWNIR